MEPPHGTSKTRSFSKQQMYRNVSWRETGRNVYKTVDASKDPATNQFVDRLSHYLQGFIRHPMWLFGISEPSTESILYLGLSPLPVTVTTRIVMFLVGDPYKPCFATVTGRGDNPNYICLARKQFVTTVRIIPQLYFTRSCPSILAGRSCECPWGVLLHPKKNGKKSEKSRRRVMFCVANRGI